MLILTLTLVQVHWMVTHILRIQQWSGLNFESLPFHYNYSTAKSGIKWVKVSHCNVLTLVTENLHTSTMYYHIKLIFQEVVAQDKSFRIQYFIHQARGFQIRYQMSLEGKWFWRYKNCYFTMLKVYFNQRLRLQVLKCLVVNTRYVKVCSNEVISIPVLSLLGRRCISMQVITY